MSEIVSLPDAVAGAVHDGDTVALEGFTHLIPFAAGHEVLRTPDRERCDVDFDADDQADRQLHAEAAAGADGGVAVPAHRAGCAGEDGSPVS